MRSQASVEFTLMVSFLLFVFLVSFYFVAQQSYETRKVNKDLIVNSFQEAIIEEVRIAYTVDDGYSRAFAVPKTIEGTKYTLGIEESTRLVVNYGNQTYQKSLPGLVRGGFCFTRDLNESYYELLISKDAGIVSLSTCPDCGYSYYMCSNAQDMGFCDIMESLSPGFRFECCDGHCKCC